MTIFDYIYYRWFKLYAKEDSDPDIYASVIVSAYQVLTIINLVSLGLILAGFERPDVKYLIPIILLFFTINYFRYERNFDLSKLDDRWRNESKEKKKRNWILLIGYLVINFLIPWVYGFSTN